MRNFRIMTYNIRSCQGSDGQVDPRRTAEVIRQGAAEIVALQDVDASDGSDQLNCLAKLVGLSGYGVQRKGANGFLSRFPMSGLREFDLGHGGICLRGDVQIGGSRLHLFNVRLDADSGKRAQQFSNLTGEELLSSPTLACPLIVLGDFAHRIFDIDHSLLPQGLKKARRVLWSGTYPARFPLTGRDKVYFSGSIREVTSCVERGSLARHASSHLPLILTFELQDTRCYLSLKDAKKAGLEVVAG